MNFLVYIRCIPVIGIYVVMLQVISKKFVRFVPVLLVLIGGFGLTYYVLLQNQDVYSTPVLALIKTSLIMFEMNFDDRIYDSNSGGINYYPVTFVVFILTGYVMTIFVINLLIGRFALDCRVFFFILKSFVCRFGRGRNSDVGYSRCCFTKFD